MAQRNKIIIFICLIILTLTLYFSNNIQNNQKININQNQNNNKVYEKHIQQLRLQQKEQRELKNFKDDMKSFPWDEYKESVESGNRKLTDGYSQKLLYQLLPYLIAPPLQPINHTCKPEEILLPLENITDQYCKEYPNLFYGKRTTPIKVGHMIQFGFDVDTLEIHLNELYDIVDHFFIIESAHTHYGGLKKPLIWEQVKYQDRFIRFQDKIIHFILDDADQLRLAPKSTGKDSGDENIFGAEKYQESRRWDKFQEWNKLKGNLYQDTDIIGFGDTDEVTTRRNIHMLKYCQLKETATSIDIGIWFPYGIVTQAFRSDYPVDDNHPFTLGDPTFHTIKKAKSSKTYPNRNRGHSGQYMFGGMHMSRYGYIPFNIAKKLSCTECGINKMEQLLVFSEDLINGTIYELEKKLLKVPEHFELRVEKLSDMDQQFNKQVAILPWFLKCNPYRYPVWHMNHDTRLD
ncbi:hypothetical protein DFA_12121 [Cavenderia fasciculata]|uniref:Beta-1,4-mannosyl-glycoprotein beta-1,4-N-acetylglucosaminyltransferase n=1 Tax=Cavenderia fasciculata TaxID=261658 RepID=F4QFV4_CACFS|nr:uncharacterized protein DFA_12121 [Cavenderia fasciculata]EGG14351.1 hypothetical protein DFA_12121 [Cavenderia fasciculata]|eukprot:XP_004351066.1 hypothetical protein DFA_12121 [Cavenderia fasciculata]